MSSSSVSNISTVEAVAAASSMTHVTNYGEELPDTARARLLTGFRGELYRGLTTRADELSGLTDAVLCADGPVRHLTGPGCRWRRGTGGGTARSMTG